MDNFLRVCKYHHCITFIYVNIVYVNVHFISYYRSIVLCHIIIEICLSVSDAFKTHTTLKPFNHFKTVSTMQLIQIESGLYPYWLDPDQMWICSVHTTKFIRPEMCLPCSLKFILHACGRSHNLVSMALLPCNQNSGGSMIPS